jgi:hypothetical protein
VASNLSRESKWRKADFDLMNIVLIGEESAGIQMLWALKRRGHSISAVISTPSKTASSGASLWNAAAKLGFDTWPAKLVKDPSLADRICSHGVDLILNGECNGTTDKNVSRRDRTCHRTMAWP